MNAYFDHCPMCGDVTEASNLDDDLPLQLTDYLCTKCRRQVPTVLLTAFHLPGSYFVRLSSGETITFSRASVDGRFILLQAGESTNPMRLGPVDVKGDILVALEHIAACGECAQQTPQEQAPAA